MGRTSQECRVACPARPSRARLPRATPVCIAGARVLLALVAAATAHAAPVPEDGVVRFSYPDTTAREVHLTGDFNGWSPTATPLDREGAAWVARVFLDPGTYAYAFVVDGATRPDPDNPERSSQGFSVVRVGADGAVLPPRPTTAPADSTAAGGAASSKLAWSLRYIGRVVARHDDAFDRADLLEPLHDVDLRVDAHLTSDVEAGFLLNATHGPGAPGFDVLWDRGDIVWAPGTASLRLFDNVGVVDRGDPGALVRRVGIYDDLYGYRTRGLAWRQRILGAPLDLVVADDDEPSPPFESNGAVVLPPPVPGSNTTYASSPSHRGADLLGLQLRAGTDDLGVAAAARLDRGRSPGVWLNGETTAPHPDTLVTHGTADVTTETSTGWSVEARTRWRSWSATAAFLWGSRRAVATHRRGFTRIEADSVPIVEWETPTPVDGEVPLDKSRRAGVALRYGEAASAAAVRPWTTRPGVGEPGPPVFAYEYEEHDFSAAITGAPFLARRHSVVFSAGTRVAGTDARVEIEQHWFRNGSGAAWDTQPWFRRHNFWLDEDVTRLERLPLLGTRTASVARLHLARLLWAGPGLGAAFHATWAAPGFEHAPRYGEGILRFMLPLGRRFELRTHSRLAVYRTFETTAPDIVARLGSGPHFEAGQLPDLSAAPVDHGYAAASAHFVEVVWTVTARSDVALGFGVDPEYLYPVTNEYADIGWDQFLFDAGASPEAARLDPAGLGRRLESAERALEGERRLALEARFRF